MGDRNYYPDQYNYGFSDQPTNHGYKAPISNLFDMGATQDSYSADNRQRRDRDRDLEQYQTLTSQTGESLGYRRERQGYNDSSSSNYDPPPPSYAESQQDRLLSRSRANTGYSPAWNYVANEEFGREEQYSQKRTVSDLFDVPSNKELSQTLFDLPSNREPSQTLFDLPSNREPSQTLFDLPSNREPSQTLFDVPSNREPSQTLFDLPSNREPSRTSSRWSDDNYSASQNYKSESHSRINPYGNNPYRQAHEERYKPEYHEDNYDELEPNDKFRDLPPREPYSFGNSSFSGPTRHGNGMGRDHNKFLPNYRGQTNDSTNQPVKSGSQPNEFKQSNFQRGRGRGRGRGGFSGQNNARKFQSDSDYQKKQSSLAGSVGEGDDDGEGEEEKEYEKIEVFRPNPTMVAEYKFFPPPPEVMGEIFKDLVIYFFFKVKNVAEKNPFVVICESFRRSTRYISLDVEDGYEIGNPSRKFCTLTYQQMMMVRGVGDNNNIKESRVLAGVELINSLAMSCYILKANPEYFSNAALEDLLQRREEPGVFRIVTQEEAPSFDLARNYLTNFFKEDSDVELIFQPTKSDLLILKGWGIKSGYACRVIKEQYVGISMRRSPQYWRDKILASGMTFNKKFTLIPPLGMGNLYWSNFNIMDLVPSLKRCPVIYPTFQNKYGPKGVGPNISRAHPPWARGRNKKARKNSKKINKMLTAAKEGQPLEQIKQYKFLSRKKKKRLKAQLGLN